MYGKEGAKAPPLHSIAVPQQRHHPYTYFSINPIVKGTISADPHRHCQEAPKISGYGIGGVVTGTMRFRPESTATTEFDPSTVPTVTVTLFLEEEEEEEELAN